MEKENIKNLLEKKLKEFTFDYENNDISGVMNLLDTEEDMQKTYELAMPARCFNLTLIYTSRLRIRLPKTKKTLKPSATLSTMLSW